MANNLGTFVWNVYFQKYQDYKLMQDRGFSSVSMPSKPQNLIYKIKFSFRIRTFP